MKNRSINRILSSVIIGSIAVLMVAIAAQAQNIGPSGLLTDAFDSSWTQFQAGGASEDGIVTPGVGGQKFDAEYLLYKLEANTLSLGLQTGFNVQTGRVKYNGKRYFAGDLALSFNGNTSAFEYGVDFGLKTRGYSNALVDMGTTGTAGVDTAGVYKNVTWNNDIYYTTKSSPFAMDEGDIIADALMTNEAGEGEATAGIVSYYRVVTLDLDKILGTDWALDGFILDTHWTMSCGNDEIDGRIKFNNVAPVPEPATMLLFGTGLLGLSGIARRKNRKK